MFVGVATGDEGGPFDVGPAGVGFGTPLEVGDGGATGELGDVAGWTPDGGDTGDGMLPISSSSSAKSAISFSNFDPVSKLFASSPAASVLHSR
jgi:hypothetical protein